MPDNPFDDALGEAPLPKVDMEASKQERWEHKVVGLILDHFGLRRFAPDLAARARGETGRRRLAFHHFKQQFSSFPLWLACRKLPDVRTLTTRTFTREWEGSLLHKTFVLAEADSPPAYWEGRLGLVFEWLHNWPVAILHNDFRPGESAGWSFVWQVPNTDPMQVMAVQPFDAFLDSLRWRPDGQ